MNLNCWRPYTAVTMMMALLIVSATGLLLFLAPHGPEGRGWMLWGLSKHTYKDIHLYLGFLAFALMLFHGYLNLKPLSHYMGNKTGAGRSWYKHPLLWGIAIVIILAGLAVLL
ncbi:DUF4405 domain-containing protein [Corallincola platygyrae]|uniref:DUF4405 domain-containing protein n=1 Tax=Corallincola platygyrae TaxID=1193278 RepID=A0ABW4XLQ2_9GAMM